MTRFPWTDLCFLSDQWGTAKSPAGRGNPVFSGAALHVRFRFWLLCARLLLTHQFFRAQDQNEESCTENPEWEVPAEIPEAVQSCPSFHIRECCSFLLCFVFIVLTFVFAHTTGECSALWWGCPFGRKVLESKGGAEVRRLKWEQGAMQTTGRCSTDNLIPSIQSNSAFLLFIKWNWSDFNLRNVWNKTVGPAIGFSPYHLCHLTPSFHFYFQVLAEVTVAVPGPERRGDPTNS